MRDIIELIENLRSGDSAAHAYILEGKSREARSRFIDELISGLGCSSLDTVRMDMSGKSSYKVEDASAFSERLMMGAYGSFLAGIIDDADSMSEIVQNKLLKTIEEPHSSVVLLLGTSNPDHLLSTVKSRCMTLRVSDYGFEDVDEEEAARLDEIAEAAALMIDDSHFYEFREAANKCVKSKADALLLVDVLEDSLREGMLSGDDPAVYAERIELAETARADIARDMDKNKALKRLFLELKG
jgi:DNA polymerase III delta prime subunit